VSVVDASVPPKGPRGIRQGTVGVSRQTRQEAAIAHLQKAGKAVQAVSIRFITLLGRAYLTQKDWKEAEAALAEGDKP